MPDPSALPTFQFQVPVPVASPQGVYGAIAGTPQSITQQALPAAAEVLGPNSPYLRSATQAVAAQGASNLSGLRDVMSRTGASRGGQIPAAAQAGNQFQTQLATGVMQSRALMEMSHQLAGEVFNSLRLDIGANQEMFSQLAQAIGQELSQQMQMSQFQKANSAAMSQAEALNAARLEGAGIGAVGSLGQGAAFGYYGRTKSVPSAAPGPSTLQSESSADPLSLFYRG